MRYVAALLLTVPTLFAVGCKPDGPTRFSLSGAVTVDGRPIKSGAITFDPDTSKRPDGPQGLAVIVDGKYDTDADVGRGSIGGPMVVRIEGTTEINGKVVEIRHKTTADIPLAASTMDFNLPAKGVKVNPSSYDD